LLDPKWAELDPSLPPIFQDFYAQTKLLDAAADILQVERTGLVMELLNMLINPLTDFGLDWHRDDIKPEATAEEEIAKLSLPDTGTQFNLALCNDSCLIVVPATHKRARNEQERAKTSGENRQEHIDGQLLVELQPGDCVFYNNNILHRATYNSAVKRVTLHGSYGHAVNGKSRSANVLQFGVADWLPDFKPTNPDLIHLKAGLERIVEENKDKPVQYSLDG
jgi:ectoine hydroxylase-related dioxygenase (phytanoyl-CoA dioxygenase family)